MLLFHCQQQVIRLATGDKFCRSPAAPLAFPNPILRHAGR